MENKQVEVGTMTKDYNLTVAELEKMSEKCSVLVENRGYSQGIVTLKELDDLSVVPQMDRKKTMRIIDLVHASVNKNDLLGIAVDSIENNINAKFRLSYNHKTQKKREEKLLERAKEIVDDFNKQVNLSGEIAKAIGVSVKKAKAYIDSVNSIAKMIAEDRVRLDYFSSPGRSSFVDNAEYGGSFDFSTLCKKRRLLTGTFTAIQKALDPVQTKENSSLDKEKLK